MKHAALALVFLVVINSQIPYNPKQGCTIVAEIKSDPGPFYTFQPGKADCGAIWAVPFGPVPSSCGKLEVILEVPVNGPIGQIVGDPLVARVVRDMKFINLTAQGYPVQYQANIFHALVGVADVPKRMDDQIKACPNIKFALVGYSQGGSVVWLATATVPLKLIERTVAVVLYGSSR